MKFRKPSKGITSGSVIAGIALAVGIGGIGYSATGGPFILGQPNSETTTSILTNPNGSALSLRSPAGTAPLMVNNSAKVANLNADRLDGFDSSAFQKKLSTITRVSGPTFTPSEGPINRQARAWCNINERAVGGGGHVVALTPDRLGEYFTFTVHSAPIKADGEPAGINGQEARGWLVEATNTANHMTGQVGRNANLYAYVVCASK
jgi:hypothetical protein